MLFRSAQVQFVEAVLLQAPRGFTGAQADKCFVAHRESTLAVTRVCAVAAADGAHNPGGDISASAAHLRSAAGAIVQINVWALSAAAGSYQTSSDPELKV